MTAKVHGSSEKRALVDSKSARVVRKKGHWSTAKVHGSSEKRALVDSKRARVVRKRALVGSKRT